MGGVVRNIGQQGLVNVEDPGVPSVAGYRSSLGVDRRIVGNGLQIRLVQIAGDVILDEIHALLRHPAPGAGVVGLHRVAPAIAVQVRSPPMAGDGVGGQKDLPFRRNLDDGWGRPSGPGAEDDDERNEAPLD